MIGRITHARWVLCVAMFCASSGAAIAQSPWLYGLHWYRDDGDVEVLTGGKGVWLLETVMLWDTSWSAAVHKSKLETAVSRGHTVICRIQPWWGYAVPPADHMSAYLEEVATAAELLKNECRIWQIGNEMNGLNEYGGQYLEPAVYVERFKQIRDAIKAVPSPLGEQIVLLGPPSVLATYWHPMLAAVGPDDFDGFTMHAYGTTPDNTDVYRNVQNFMEAVSGQLAWIDAAGGIDNEPGVFASKPVFITEFDRCNHPANDPTQEATGSQFLYRAYGKLHDWNLRQGDYAGMTTHPVVAACWFIYPESSSNWDCYSLVVHKEGPRGKDVNLWDAYQYAAGLDYPAGVIAPLLVVRPTAIARAVTRETDPGESDAFEIDNAWIDTMSYMVQEEVGWLSVDPQAGTTQGGAHTITVSYETASLPVGVHTADITVSAPGTEGSPQVVAVTLEVKRKPGDFDDDGDVDQVDFGAFQLCFTGPGVEQFDPDCQHARMDIDVDVDQDDFALFQDCITGANVASSPTCAD